MLRIITPDPLPADPLPVDAAPEDAAPGEFEIVVGKRQIASLLFVGVVVLTIFTSGAYMIGRAQGQRREVAKARAPEPVQPAQPPVQFTPPAPAPEPVLTPAPIPQVAALPKPPAPTPPPRPQLPVATPAPVQTGPPPALPPISDEIEASLFAEPIPGVRYLQVGSVDRGVAVILAEGLRTRGFNGFIASGTKEGIYRVLVGPLRTNEEYLRAREAVDRMGVNTFTRQFAK